MDECGQTLLWCESCKRVNFSPRHQITAGASPSRMVAPSAHPPAPSLIHLPSARPTIASLTPTGSAGHASRRRFSLSSCTPVVTVLVTPLPSRQEIGSGDAVRSVCLHVASVNVDPFRSVHPLSKLTPTYRFWCCFSGGSNPRSRGQFAPRCSPYREGRSGRSAFCIRP